MPNAGSTVGIFLDLSKAYDVINHNRLLDKLDSYRIRGSVNNWFQSYLTNRTQFVEMSQTDRNKYTQHRFQYSSRETSHGTPQGSILGPLLFLIYRVSQEEWTKLRESVPYVKIYRYNPKHLYPKLNGYGDNGQRSLKV